MVTCYAEKRKTSNFWPNHGHVQYFRDAVAPDAKSGVAMYASRRSFIFI